MFSKPKLREAGGVRSTNDNEMCLEGRNFESRA
jgi:hypothetical protein